MLTSDDVLRLLNVALCLLESICEESGEFPYLFQILQNLIISYIFIHILKITVLGKGHSLAIPFLTPVLKELKGVHENTSETEIHPLTQTELGQFDHKILSMHPDHPIMSSIAFNFLVSSNHIWTVSNEI